MAKPCVADRPHAAIAETPHNGWYSGTITSWMISLAGTTRRSSCSPVRLSRKLVVDGAIVRYERPHPIGVQNVQGSDDAALIAFFQNVGVPMDQLAGDPVCEELDAVLVSVWAPQDRGEGGKFGFLPDTLGVLPNETQPELRNIVSDQRDAGEDCGVGEG